MSKTHEQVHPFLLRSAMLLALGAVGTGCTAFAGGGTPTGEAGDDDGQTPSDGKDPSDQVSEEDAALRRKCSEATEKSKALLESRCASCHGGSGAAMGGFDTVMNINRLIDDGRVSPGRPESSPLYALVKDGAMPPASVSDRPTEQDVQHLSDWITCGAPALARASDAPPFIGLDERLATMLADLRSFEPQERRDIRYIDLYTLANAGFSEAELEEYREALSFLLNSLSNGLRVASPQRVDDRGLLFRIELDDYGWSDQTWANIAEEYPYSVVYDDDSSVFAVDEGKAEDLRELTGEPIPYLQADWFVSHAVRPPLYYDILEIPNNLDALAADLGIESIEDNIEGEEVARVGFRNASSSQNDRVLERHELPGSRGSMWISYDFDNGVGSSNVLANPLAFEAAGMQITFNLKNGLQGFMITDASGNRVDEADNDILQDALSRNGAAEAGVSCLSCHQKSGITPRNDEVRAAVTASSTNGDIKGDVFALYPEQSEMDDLFAEDVARYEDARSRTILTDLADNAMHEINNRHLKTLDMAGVAAVLGMKVEDLKEAIERADNGNQKDENGNSVLPADLLGLAKGIAVRRDQFEASFPEFVVALGLGKPFRRNELVDGQIDADGSSNDDDSSASDGSSDGTSDGSDGSDSSDRGTSYP